MNRNTLMYTAEKHRGLWWVIDHEGYEVSSVGYDTKREAMESARIHKAEEEARARYRATKGWID